MKRVLIVGGCLVALAGCEMPGLGGERPGSDGDARASAGAATELVDSMAGRNRLPQRDYVCTLIGPNRDLDAPYGMMGINTDRYTLVVKGEGRKEGTLSVNADRHLQVEGDLVVVSGEVRRVTRGRVNSEGQTVELAFDFAPADSEGRNQVVCTAEA